MALDPTSLHTVLETLQYTPKNHLTLLSFEIGQQMDLAQ
jgi:hypothetical protein